MYFYSFVSSVTPQLGPDPLLSVRSMNASTVFILDLFSMCTGYTLQVSETVLEMHSVEYVLKKM